MPMPAGRTNSFLFSSKNLHFAFDTIPSSCTRTILNRRHESQSIVALGMDSLVMMMILVGRIVAGLDGSEYDASLPRRHKGFGR